MPRSAPFLARRVGHRFPPLFLTLALSCPGGAAESGTMVPVMVGDLSLSPAGDLRDTEQRFEVHPLALLGGGWNSAALVAPDGDGRPDTYSHGIAGILVRYHPHLGLDADLDAELEHLRYQRYRALDTNAGRLRGNVDYVAPELSWHGDAGWTRSQQNLLSTGEAVSEDLYQARGRIRHDSPVWWEEADVGAAYLNYRQGTTTFDARQGDHATYDAGIRGGIHAGDDRWFASLRGEQVRYAVSTRFNDCNAVTATAGGLFATSPRTDLHLEAGMALRRYSDDYLHDPANDDRLAIAPWLDFGGHWSWREGSRVGVRLYSDLGDSLTSNATWSVGAEAASHFELSARFSIEASAGASENRDGGINDSGTVVQRHVSQGSVSGQYTLAEGLVTRLRTTAIQVSSPDSESYHRVVVSLDLAYAY